ncbi:2,3,4,5-tetrahydropyridine-2,6-dicarboxylate N-succinyltransferase [Candidatus Berkiella cookevillensis]|uniref:2,3,4,5-tetrahydropyridine-2,6-dicarboxylate N-succinyltransferase n=2 Tax=Candidatus Berkiella cookevillensis TaxID=437022 RepID=A0A0Q9YHR7_9GAMM|nr:2,3,4,5-tetrahydropyridine-2,6-dicarboxylate N-succinyltransferase [Candidatus Berkiella cookevillensis]
MNNNLHSDAALMNLITQAWNQRADLSPTNPVFDPIKKAVTQCFSLLEVGALRVAHPTSTGWQVNEWVKQAILLSFKLFPNKPIDGGFTQFFDKLPLQFQNFTQSDFENLGARIVPPACVRIGAHLAKNTIIMPSYINVGAFVDTGTLVDTWATIGSCAQIGKNVHISGGVGIGGVLEPLQASPTIIEDNCFIGARSEIVEGVIVEENSVISMGVYIGQSTRIYDRETGEIYYGRVPRGSVVVSGTLPSSDKKYNLYAAIIVKKVDDKTRQKVAINELLRDCHL